MCNVNLNQEKLPARELDDFLKITEVYFGHRRVKSKL